MAIVKYKWWIQLMKYKYKENHLHTYTLPKNILWIEICRCDILWLPLQEVMEGAEAWSKPTGIGNDHGYLINFKYAT